MRTMTTPASLLTVALALFAPVAEAQSAPTATQIAAEIQGFYDQTTTVRTTFYQSHYDRLYRRTTRSRGVLTIARPGKMRFDYLAGNGKVVMTDGEVLSVYEPDGDGGPGQYAQTALEDGLPSALGFLAGTARLDRDFSFRLRDASALHWDGYVLELRPRRPEPGYRRVLLYVDDDPATRGVVRRVLVQDHEGNLNRFDFSRMRFGEAVPSSQFVFAPPTGARRI
ncbi:MAG: outer membrane lipoprotein carrier protein LolA [Sandaracinaceae bacterium]|nr:outer membrane lipoprotein carrier protein LolA [Sandaracinaceae bacterium]